MAARRRRCWAGRQDRGSREAGNWSAGSPGGRASGRRPDAGRRGRGQPARGEEPETRSRGEGAAREASSATERHSWAHALGGSRAAAGRIGGAAARVGASQDGGSAGVAPAAWLVGGPSPWLVGREWEAGRGECTVEGELGFFWFVGPGFFHGPRKMNTWSSLGQFLG